MQFPDDIDEWAVAVVPVGSRVTCNPPPTGTDQDLLVLIDEGEDILSGFEQKLSDWDWEYESEKYADTATEFDSWRKTVDGTEFNIILTQDPKWFDTFLDATFSCKEKNLLTKEGRIEEFEKFFGKKEKKKPVYVGGVIAKASLAEIEAKIMLKQQQAMMAAQAQQNLWANNPFQLTGVQGNTVYFDDLPAAPAQGTGIGQAVVGAQAWWNFNIDKATW